jgi:hypothetical protein
VITDCASQCNGFSFLCGRKYDDVAYLTTHNAFNNSADGFMLPNQNNTITQQLNDGVRAFMIDVYNKDGVATVYHGFSYLGSKPLTYNLVEIKSFLDNNPNEIVTIIFECHTTSGLIETALTETGLMNFLFVKDALTEWPTLQEMINMGKRLVIFSEADNAIPGQDWYHYIWEHAVETDFSFSDSSQFSCDFNRGDSINELFILNHFITNSITGTGMPDEAAIVNASPYLINRLTACMIEKNKFPNFIAVDFYETGNCKDAVDSLNRQYWSGNDEYESKHPDVNVWPNPGNGVINIDFENDSEFDNGDIKIFNQLGREVYRKSIRSKEMIINISGVCSRGLYFLQLRDKQQNVVLVKKIIFAP